MSKTPVIHSVHKGTADSGRIRLGGALRLPAITALPIADAGKIRLGGALRLPANRAPV
ncbi:MAG: hypothetical protein JO227_17905 [Acetobacteraceae bacterium]|nr:hypothetical protein [Acetobacteraceae bacterium]